MTHDTKERYWFFYVKDEETNQYSLYAYTNDAELAENFSSTRDMSKFYMKSKKLDRMNFNALYKRHMLDELKWHEGHYLNIKKYTAHPYTISVTRNEERVILNSIGVYLHEGLYHFVWDNISVLKDKYIEALDVLGYVPLQTLIYYGTNPIDDAMQQSLVCDDMKILTDEFGWTFFDSERGEDE